MVTVQMVVALTAKQRHILTTVNAGASALSLGGSAFIVLCYLFFKELRKFSFKLIIIMAGSPLQHGGTSLAMTVIQSIGNDHGRLGAWCWIQTGRTGKVVHFIIFYAPLWGAILFNGFIYFQVIRMLNNATCMAVGMSVRLFQVDSRADMKGLFNSIAYGLNASV